MKICFIANAMDIHTTKWVNYFAGRGHEIHLISTTPGEGYADGVRIYQLTVPLPQKFWAVLRSVNMLARIIKVRRLINRIKPDIVNTHYVTSNGFLGAVSGFHPLVSGAWGSDILLVPKRNVYVRGLRWYALRQSDLVTCDSEVLREKLIELGVDPVRIRLIYNGVDTRKFKPQPDKKFRARLGLEGVPVVISTRKLAPVYNVEMLIRAIPHVLKSMPQARFIIAGDGEQGEYIRGLADSLGVSQSIRFVGWVTPDELADYLAASDIYVSTSRSDSTSLSLHEAMASELAPVVTDLPANREWITDGDNGFIVPQDDVPALVDRIVYLLKNEDVKDRFGREGRGMMKERAEYENEMAKMEKVYQEMITAGKSSRKKLEA